MNLLLRGSDLVRLPVVTLAGDDVAEVREVVFDATARSIVGFTLNKRGFLHGRLRDGLAMGDVHALGPHAVMVDDEARLHHDAMQGTSAQREPGGGNVLGAAVLTDAGTRIGTVTDVVIDLDPSPHVIGYEVEPADEVQGRKGRRSYLPVPDTLAISGEALVVPQAATEYIATDMAGFAEAVERYRASLRGGAS